MSRIVLEGVRTARTPLLNAAHGNFGGAVESNGGRDGGGGESGQLPATSWPPLAYSTRVFATTLQTGMLSTGCGSGINCSTMFYSTSDHFGGEITWVGLKKRFVRPQSFYYVIAVFGQNCVFIY
jgi:hypothetical protein